MWGPLKKKNAGNNLHVIEGKQSDRDKKITNARDLINVLEDVIRCGYPILIMVEDIELEALTTLVVNKFRRPLKIVALKAPGFGECKSQYLDDITIMIGETVIRDEVGLTLDKAEEENETFEKAMNFVSR